MSLDAYLNQSGSISRAVTTGATRYNNAATRLAIIAGEVRCRKTQKTMRLMDERTGEYAFVNADLVLFAAGTDVKPKDEVTISSQVWRVVQVLKRQRANEQHHVSCIVEAINAT